MVHRGIPDLGDELLESAFSGRLIAGPMLQDGEPAKPEHRRRLLEISRARLFQPLQLHQGIAHEGVGVGDLRVELERAAILGNRSLVAAGDIGDCSGGSMRPRIERVERERPVDGIVSLPKLARPDGVERVQQEDVGIAPPIAIRRVIGRLCPANVEAASEQRIAQRQVSLGERRCDRNRPARFIDGGGIERLQLARVGIFGGDRRQRSRQGGVSQSEMRIRRDRDLVIGSRFAVRRLVLGQIVEALAA